MSLKHCRITPFCCVRNEHPSLISSNQKGSGEHPCVLMSTALNCELNGTSYHLTSLNVTWLFTNHLLVSESVHTLVLFFTLTLYVNIETLSCNSLASTHPILSLWKKDTYLVDVILQVWSYPVQWKNKYQNALLGC